MESTSHEYEKFDSRLLTQRKARVVLPAGNLAPCGLDSHWLQWDIITIPTDTIRILAFVRLWPETVSGLPIHVC
jgi:hypothetical protein